MRTMRSRDRTPLPRLARSVWVTVTPVGKRGMRRSRCVNRVKLSAGLTSRPRSCLDHGLVTMVRAIRISLHRVWIVDFAS